MEYTIQEERLSAAECMDFLKQTALGSQYSKERFEERLEVPVRKAPDLAGGEKNIIMYTCANENAVPFYEKPGMTMPHDMMVYDHAEWTSFTVE